jgi:hypothetical protein
MKRGVSILFLLLSLLGGFACGSSRNSDADKVTRALALTLRTFINFFQDNLKNCDAFFEIYDAISEAAQPCDNPEDGTFQLTKFTVACSDGPPLTANALFTLEQINCKDNGTEITSTGLMDMILDFSAAGNFGTLASVNLLAQDMSFVFTDFITKVDLSSNNLSCSDSGDLTVDGQDCSVASNCQRCVF